MSSLNSANSCPKTGWITTHSKRLYPREFKEEAVALITDQGYSVQKAADSLGIRSNLLYR